MSILFNRFTSPDEAIEYMANSDIAPLNPDDYTDPHWRRGFFMAMQAAHFRCPPRSSDGGPRRMAAGCRLETHVAQQRERIATWHGWR